MGGEGGSLPFVEETGLPAGPPITVSDIVHIPFPSIWVTRKKKIIHLDLTPFSVSI